MPYRPQITVAMAAGLALAACHDGSVDRQPALVSATIPLGTARPLGWTSAVVVRGDGLPVDLRFAFKSAPVVGQPFGVTLALAATAPQPELTVRWSGDDGLTTDDKTSFAVDRLDPGNSPQFVATLTASTAGWHLLTLRVVRETGGSAIEKTVQVPMLVTNP